MVFARKSFRTRLRDLPERLKSKLGGGWGHGEGRGGAWGGHGGARSPCALELLGGSELKRQIGRGKQKEDRGQQGREEEVCRRPKAKGLCYQRLARPLT